MQITPDPALRGAEVSAPSMLEAAQQHLRAAEYDEALSLLQGCEDWPAPTNEDALLVKAEILVRRDPVQALEVLARGSDLFSTPAGRFGYFLASGKAYANSRNYDSAAAMFRSAEVMMPLGDATWRSRLGYNKARLRWMTRSFDPACPEITAALGDQSSDGQFRALALRAWMHAGLEDYAAQIADLSAAMQLALANLAQCDTASVATAVHAFLRVAFETGDAKAVALGEAVYEALHWTPDIQVERFQSIRVLGWDAFLHGKSARAQWLFKDSKNLAPSKAWKVMAHVDRAYVARMNLNEIWATEELLQAHKIAREVVWSATQGEERFALVTLAILFAPIDMGQAQRYVSTYIQMGTENLNPTLGATNDRRAIAGEKYASGCVQQVLGHKEIATEQLSAAYTIYSETGQHHRASLAAMSLSEVTGSPEWLAKAREHAAHFPNSPINERLNDTQDDQADDGLAALSPMQRQIALALCEGLDVEELSHRFSRSTFTLTKQVELIYEALGVKSRSELRTALEGKAF